MAQKIQQASIFGRVGSGIGKGLAEQVPKEIERSRLSSGLESLSKEGTNLSPFQQYSRLLALPGMTPQGLQGASDLLRMEGMRNSYKAPREGDQRQGEQVKQQQQGQGRLLNDIKFANLPENQINNQNEGRLVSDQPNRYIEAQQQPGIVTENPTQQKFQPLINWTPQQREEAIAKAWDRHPNFTFDQIQAKVSDDERRELEAPARYREQLEYSKGIEKEADSEFDTQLETALQKRGDEIYKDLSGENILNMKKAMYNDLATNPSLTPKTAAENWIKKGRDFAEAKNIIKAKAKRDFTDKLSPGKKEELLKSLKSAQKKYEEMGSKREFYNMLTSKNSEKGVGFDLSPGYAALIAYPRSEKLKEVVRKSTASEFRVPSVHHSVRSKKVAEDFAKNRSYGDSILAFAREMKDKNAYFDESAFFDYLRDNESDFGFNPDQRKELQTGVSDMFPNWGDLTLFPLTGKSKAHD